MAFENELKRIYTHAHHYRTGDSDNIKVNRYGLHSFTHSLVRVMLYASTAFDDDDDYGDNNK